LRARPLPAVIPTDADLRTAVALMFTHGVTWLACVDGEGRFIGQVTQAGIMRLLGETYQRPDGTNVVPIQHGAVA
jgi:osmoprotectant transport system ATP-binding protein